MKIGDRIQLNWPGHPTHGQVGTVREKRSGEGGGWYVSLDADGGVDERWYRDELLFVITACSGAINPTKFETSTGALR
jgi:hypothetical protein